MTQRSVFLFHFGLLNATSIHGRNAGKAENPVKKKLFLVYIVCYIKFLLMKQVSVRVYLLVALKGERHIPTGQITPGGITPGPIQ